MTDVSPPVPDPTVLTTEQLLREIGSVRELIDARMEGAREIHGAMAEIADEKFRSVNQQFLLVEDRRKEQKTDTETAVAAAFSSAKEGIVLQTAASEAAISKSETATTKSIDGLAATFRTADEAQRRDVDDLKRRIGMIESVKQGASEQRAATREGVTFAQGLVASAVVLLMVVLNVVGIAYSRSNSQDRPPDPVTVTVTEP